jgi:hypothetical protein
VARDGGWKPFPERNKSSLSDSQFVSFSWLRFSLQKLVGRDTIT